MTANRVGARTRRAGTALGLVALAASLVVGSDLFGAREGLFGSATPPPKASAFSRVADSPTAAGAGSEKTVLRSSPWWQEVDSFDGVGTTTTPAFEIQEDAIQWRVGWTCKEGRLVVRAPGSPEPLIDARCPGKATTEAAGKIDGGLEVTADGPWQLRVEQQIDVPLDEPPLPAMTGPDAVKVATGDFYRVDQVGNGQVIIYRLPDGRHALRLQGFYVTPNIDLEIRLSPLRAPKTTREFRSAPSKLVKFLDVTAGSMNFAVPRGVDPTRYRSVVIWCEQVVSAYAAAALRPAL